MQVTDFFNKDYVNYSSYDNLRKIASVMDGQKNAARKVLYTILEKNIKEELKVEQLSAKAAEFSQYLHGNMYGVICNLAQDFVGTNNIPLLVREGNFGTRFAQEPSAPRYIYTHGSKEFFNLFKKEDSQVLIKQYFEDQVMEPRFYVPNLPLLVINGSEGVSSGFAQKILPRNPEDVKKYILDKINGRTPKKNLTPFFKGFKGTITQGESSSQIIISGCVEKKSVNKVQITEVPIGYDLRSYLSVLDELEEKGVIQSYTDKSESDVFLFDVIIPSKSLSTWSEDELLQKLKLQKKVTENYTAMNELNKIEVFNDIYAIIDRYIEIKLQYLEERKKHLLQSLEENIRFDFSKHTYIKAVTEESLKINKRKKVEIENDIQKIPNIIKREESYDYLLNMPMISVTVERMKSLENSIKEKKQELDALRTTSVQKIWEGEINGNS